jgi:hypothetical protein
LHQAGCHIVYRVISWIEDHINVMPFMSSY